MRYENEYRRFAKDYETTEPMKLNLGPYWLLAGLRVVLTIIFQIGYIHPDEYFQSIEVIAGDYFDIDVNRPWEFNNTFPIRSAAIPYLTVGIPYSILKTLSPFSFYLFGTTLKSPFFLVLFPRLLVLSLSFMSDYCLYRICYIYGQNYRNRLITYASSYVIITYATRTLSNAVELALTSLLLYFVADCMAYSDKIVFQTDWLCEKYNKSKNVVDRVKYYKLRASLPSHSLNHCFILATITVAGIFNRPTFIAFALPPIFFWLQRGLGSKSIGFGDFHIRMLTFILCGIPTAILLILTDSFYFGYLTISEIQNLKISMDNFVVTPLNFLKYNSNSKNLETHGLHPRFLHFLINVPLLYNVLGAIGLFEFGRLVYRGMRARWSELPRVQSIIGLMTASFILPISILSVFPHQEPRFIIPVTLPLIFLHAQKIRQVSNVDTVAHISSQSSTKFTFKRNQNKTNAMLTTWYIINILLTFFYGFAHQGGVLPITTHLAAELRSKPHSTHIHLFTSHTFPIPTALLHLRNTHRVYVTRDKHKYKLSKDFHLYEQGSKEVGEIYDNIASTFQECERNLESKRTAYRLYYALPATFLDEFIEYAFKNNSETFHFKSVRTFYPHVSIERLPPLSIFNECTSLNDLEVCTRKIVENASENFYNFVKQFGLVLLRIESLSDESKQISAV